MSKIALSISLVKEGVQEDSVLKEAGTTHCSIGNIGVLYYKNSNLKQARKIKDFFGEKFPEGQNGEPVPNLYTANVQAVLIVKRQIDNVSRTFLVTFGLGRNLINADCIQEKFGMLVVLNSIAPGTVRSVDVNILESVPKHDRMQSSKLSKINTFNLNSERDLLRVVTGNTQKAYKNRLGDSVTGSDTLKVSIDITVDDLPNRLDEIYRIYRQTNYKDDFGFIDMITPLKDNSLREILNAELVRRINDRELNLVWMSIPEIFDWENLGAFRYTPKGLDYCDMEIDSLLSDVYFDEQIDFSALNSRRVYAINTAHVEIGNWSVYRCLCTEVENGGKQYILSNGQWYQLDEGFSREISNYYESVRLTDLNFADARFNETESEYNKRVADDGSNHLLLMDQRLIQPAIGRDKIEVCDIFTTRKEFIHIKRYSGSATLSHLFNQGFVSGELMMQKGFRELYNRKLEELANNEEHRNLDAWKMIGDFKQEEYTVIFAIISDNEGDRPSIPFFSKVAFRNICRKLEGFGYQVRLMKIKVNKAEDARPELTTKRAERKQKELIRRNAAQE